MRPPATASTRHSTSVLPMWYSGGHHVPKPSTKTRKQVSMDAATSRSRTTGSMAVSVMTALSFARRGRLGGGDVQGMGGLGGDGEAVEGSRPHPVEIGAEHVEPSRIEPVDPARPRLAVDDEPGLAQDPEVQRDGRAGDGQLGCQLADGSRALGQEV